MSADVFGLMMTDEEIDDLLIKLAAAKVAQYQKRDPAYTPPDDLPEGIEAVSSNSFGMSVRNRRAPN